MLQKITEYFLEYQIRNKHISEDDRELYLYAYKILVLEILNVVMLIIIGAAFQCLFYLVLFSVFYIPLRKYAGGYHAETPWRCTVMSAGLEVLIAVCLRYFFDGRIAVWFYGIVFLSQIIIWFRSPVAAVHKPLTEKQILLYRKKSRIIVLAELIVMLLCMYIEANKAVFLIGMGHVILMILMLMPQKKNR